MTEKTALQVKMERLMRGLIKKACEWSFVEFLEHWDLTLDDYEQIKEVWRDKLGIW